jgi:hypothetical protein
VKKIESKKIESKKIELILQERGKAKKQEN